MDWDSIYRNCMKNHQGFFMLEYVAESYNGGVVTNFGSVPVYKNQHGSPIGTLFTDENRRLIFKRF